MGADLDWRDMVDHLATAHGYDRAEIRVLPPAQLVGLCACLSSATSDGASSPTRRSSGWAMDHSSSLDQVIADRQRSRIQQRDAEQRRQKQFERDRDTARAEMKLALKQLADRLLRTQQAAPRPLPVGRGSGWLLHSVYHEEERGWGRGSEGDQWFVSVRSYDIYLRTDGHLVTSAGYGSEDLLDELYIGSLADFLERQGLEAGAEQAREEARAEMAKLAEEVAAARRNGVLDPLFVLAMLVFLAGIGPWLLGVVKVEGWVMGGVIVAMVLCVPMLIGALGSAWDGAERRRRRKTFAEARRHADVWGLPRP